MALQRKSTGRWIQAIGVVGALLVIAGLVYVAWRPEVLLGKGEPLVRSVTVFPPAAVQQGASWRLVGSWQAPGRQGAGQELWAVEFKPVADWDVPAPIVLPQGQRGIEVRGVYQASPFQRQPPLRVAGSVVLADTVLAWAQLFLSQQGAGEIRCFPGPSPDTKEVEGVFFSSKSRASIVIRAVGSEHGMTALRAGACDVALISRPPTPQEVHEGVRASLVGYAALAVVVSPDVPLRVVDMESLRAIFLGRFGNWRELGAPDSAIFRVDVGSEFATAQAFRQLALGGKAPEGAEVAPSPAAVDAIVANRRGAIGFTTLAMVRRAIPLALRADAGSQPVAPTPASLADGSYPLVRPLFVAVREGAPALTVQFAAAAASEQGKHIASQFGLTPSR